MISPFSILIIDDEELLSRTLAMILRRSGYDVDCSLTGKDALQRIISKAYDLLFVDIGLPDSRDLDLLRTLHDFLPKAKKYILSGSISASEATKAIHGWADGYLPKPIDPIELLSMVNGLAEEKTNHCLSG